MRVMPPHVCLPTMTPSGAARTKCTASALHRSAAFDLRPMQMITEAGAGQITLTIIMMRDEISNVKRLALAGIYSAAWRRLALANDRRVSIGSYFPSRKKCQNVQPLQAGRPCASAPIL
jgi:hypothetical protein